ncbi:MAG: CheY-like chemotaxis protein [Lysobacterales bacterium]|jgi:CheY-like chemotaxis protein
MISRPVTKQNKNDGILEAGRKNVRILIADDDVITLSVNKMMLEQAGYQVETVTDGQAAIEILRKSTFDMVFMDCLMPVMDGFTATRTIRSSAPEIMNGGIPVVALTGLATPPDLAKCKDAGMDDVLIKPVDPHQLLAMAEYYLEAIQKERLLSGQSNGEPDARVLHSDETQSVTEPKSVEEFQESISDKFLQQIPQVISDLTIALLHEDMTELQFIVHRLRGSADVVGASKLSILAATVEAAIKDNKSALALKHTPELMGKLEKLQNIFSESSD